MSPEEALALAVQELKRADHSIAVSLKYTRTVDVIKSIIERLINTVGFCLDALLEHAKAKGTAAELAALPRLKAEQVKMVFSNDKKVVDFCDFFLLLRRVDKAKFERAQEYRRHVTMTAHLDNEENVEVTIDIITDYYDKTQEFLNYVGRMVTGKNE